LFWTIGGIPGQLADHYPRIQRVDVDAIREALVSWSITCPSEYVPGSDWRARSMVILRYWIRDQLDYFERRAVQNATLVRLSRWGAEVLLFSGLLVAVSAGIVRLDSWRIRWNAWALDAAIFAVAGFMASALARAAIGTNGMAGRAASRHGRSTSAQSQACADVRVPRWCRGHGFRGVGFEPGSQGSAVPR
jgi:hypothetical protein